MSFLWHVCKRECVYVHVYIHVNYILIYLFLLDYVFMYFYIHACSFMSPHVGSGI